MYTSGFFGDVSFVLGEGAERVRNSTGLSCTLVGPVALFINLLRNFYYHGPGGGEGACCTYGKGASRSGIPPNCTMMWRTVWTAATLYVPIATLYNDVGDDLLRMG